MATADAAVIVAGVVPVVVVIADVVAIVAGAGLVETAEVLVAAAVIAAVAAARVNALSVRVDPRHHCCHRHATGYGRPGYRAHLRHPSQGNRFVHVAPERCFGLAAPLGPAR